MTHRFFRWLAGLLGLMLLPAAPVFAQEGEAPPIQRVLMLASDDSALHQRVLTAMELRLRGVEFVRARSIAGTPASRRDLIAFDCGECLIVASGTEALRMALDHSREANLLAIAIPEDTFERMIADRAYPSRASAIYMDVALNDMARAISDRLDARTVAVITGDGLYLERERRRGHATTAVRFVEYPVSQEADLIPVFQQAAREAEAILALPDPRIYNRDTIVRIMLTTYRTGTPLIGYSEAMNRAGALMSVFATPEMLGQDAAQEVATAVYRGEWQSLRRHTREFTVAVNRQVARSLRITVREAP